MYPLTPAWCEEESPSSRRITKQMNKKEGKQTFLSRPNGLFADENNKTRSLVNFEFEFVVVI